MGGGSVRHESATLLNKRGGESIGNQRCNRPKTKNCITEGKMFFGKSISVYSGLQSRPGKSKKISNFQG